jgi:UDP-glucose 4-epimerase
MLDMEQLIRSRSRRFVIVRAANVYGPGQPARKGQGVVAHWLRATLERRPVDIYGRDDVARDYVYIDDLVDALIRAGTAADPLPDVVNVGSGVPVTLAELVNAMQTAISPWPLTVARHPARAFDAPSTWLDVSLAEAALGWKPCTQLAEGLRATWHELRARADRPAATAESASPFS